MKSLIHWMVGLDFTASDSPLLDYVAYLAKQLRPARIHFVHLLQPVDVPDEMMQYLPEEALLTAEATQEKLQQRVQPLFTDLEISCEVYENTSGFQLWQKAQELEVDLFFAGSKPKEEGRGILAHKFVRKSGCSVCFVPINVSPKLQKVLVPVDFSNYAEAALRQAVALARQQADCQVVCLHVFELPHAYYYDYFPRQQLTELVKQRARREYDTFRLKVDTHGVTVEVILRLLEHSYIAEHIRQEAETLQVDLILMSAGGQSAISRLLLGSEAERIVQMEKNIPVLILKEE
jgi:nucleotide-binding universal stress UspA family protein